MFKITLSGLALFIGMIRGFSQRMTIDTSYKTKILKIEEVNIVSSYYSQNGNHSAVTGGVGTEKLSDQSNVFELSMLRSMNPKFEHRLTIGLGIDTYTSASSDKIDPSSRIGRNGVARTSASYQDVRVYPSAHWSQTNRDNGITFGAGLSFSTEYDYFSKGASLSLGKTSKSKNTDIQLNVSAFLDTWYVILPIELRPPGQPRGEDEGGISGISPRNSFTGSVLFNQVINRKLQLGFMIEPTFQDGLLGTSYQRVYFQDGKVASENLPSKRSKIPISVRASYFLGDQFILRPYYRFYQDSWGLKAHTFQLETVVKINPHFSLSPGYRFNTQNGIRYFAPYGQHVQSDSYYTSDYDLSTLTSQQFSLGARFVPSHGVFGISHFSNLEIRYSHYRRSTDLSANVITLALSFK